MGWVGRAREVVGGAHPAQWSPQVHRQMREATPRCTSSSLRRPSQKRRSSPRGPRKRRSGGSAAAADAEAAVWLGSALHVSQAKSADPSRGGCKLKAKFCSEAVLALCSTSHPLLAEDHEPWGCRALPTPTADCDEHCTRTWPRQACDGTLRRRSRLRHQARKRCSTVRSCLRCKWVLRQSGRVTQPRPRLQPWWRAQPQHARGVRCAPNHPQGARRPQRVRLRRRHCARNTRHTIGSRGTKESPLGHCQSKRRMHSSSAAVHAAEPAASAACFAHSPAPWGSCCSSAETDEC